MEAIESIQKNIPKRKTPKRRKHFGSDFKLQVVKKFLEESVPASVIQEECELSKETIGRWVRKYRQFGEAGFAPGGLGEGLHQCR